jgi:hypothetical protein
VYTRTFPTPTSCTGDAQGGTDLKHLLVFDGIRQGAMIRLNGKFLGNASNQFQRYIFNLEANDLVQSTCGGTLGSGSSNNTLTMQSLGSHLAAATRTRQRSTGRPPCSPGTTPRAIRDVPGW